MKNIIISSLLICSVAFSAQNMSTEEAGCIQDLENEVVKIVNSEVKQQEQVKAIEALKGRINTDTHETCESSFEHEIQQIVFGDKKIEAAEVIEKHAKKAKKNSTETDMNAQDCIDNFEAEVLKIINSNPDNINKDKTQQVMHEIMHEKIVESCETEFEAETKKIVHTK